MRLVQTRTPSCDRARSAISLQLDGQLSQLEAALLRSHLDRCAACREFASDARAFTVELRDAELEPIPHPVSVPARTRRVSLRSVQVGAAAAAAFVVAGVGSLVALRPQEQLSFAQRAKLAVAQDVEPVQRELRRMPGAQPGELVPAKRVGGTRSSSTPL